MDTFYGQLTMCEYIQINLEAMKTKEKKTETLTFVRRTADALETAHVVTNGHQVRTYMERDCRAHGSLNNAIIYLELKGFRIDPDAFMLQL